ncbi:triosephosphate isomerase [Pararhodospirillum oryzae]|uniref:Triosephosphate isomerase n=2 Tax=Pararhodospirillum oryzae TaxID=478448 RepID=A0A512H8T0_9PROT|nr:triosephosphate isomerase [Pararhodospirillum oryzae]
MNGLKAEARILAEALASRVNAIGSTPFDLLVCPPFPVLSTVVGAVAGTGIGVGGQDCHAKVSGAHTGDVSAAMLVDQGCQFVILGHSERRADHHESDDVVQAKVAAALAAGLVAVVCVGETEAQRDAGETLAVVSSQLAGSLPSGADPRQLVIAYEPVWAIGTGRTPTIEDVAQVHAAIRWDLSRLLGAEAAAGVRVLYGGSVKPDNAQALMALDDVDGALVGGASLKADDFWAIAMACPAP